ncbi:MAG: hypothetical protein V1888_00780 [archaeon]
MERKVMVYWGVGFFVLIMVIFFVWNNFGVESEVVPVAVRVPSSVPVPTPVVPQAVNFESYNIDYMNDAIKNILVGQLGASGKTAFYLPSTGYVNVSRGTKYGVAFAIKNVNPKIPEGNRFVYNFNVDPLSVGSCGVSVDVAQSWIERGWSSNGIIGGQWREDWNEWHDAMTIYFSFPADVEPCNVKYDFVITKDGAAYDSRTLEFNLV